MVGEREPPWHAGGGEDGGSKLVNGGARGSDGGQFSHHNGLARVRSYKRRRPPRLQKCQATHLGPNAQSPLCRWLLDLHRLRNVQPCRHLASGRTDFDEIENENEVKNDASMEGMGREKENLAVKTRFYFCNKMFLGVSVILLGFGFSFFFCLLFFFFFFFLQIFLFFFKF